MKKMNFWFIMFLFLVSNLAVYKLLCPDPWDVNKILVDGGKKEWVALNPEQKIAVCLEATRRMGRHSLESELYVRMADKAYAEPEFNSVKLSEIISNSAVAILRVEMLMRKMDKENLPSLNGLPELEKVLPKSEMDLPKPNNQKPKFIDPFPSDTTTFLPSKMVFGLIYS